MGRLGRRTVAVLAAAIVAVGAPTARAADDSRALTGRCGFDTFDVGGQDKYVGTGYALVGLYSRTHGNAVRATVSCDLRVDGVLRQRISGTGTGVVAFAAPMSFTATVVQTVDLCTEVDYLSDDTPTDYRCSYATTMQIPPQEVIDLIDLVLWLAMQPEYAYVDPAVCAVFPLLAPGAGPLTVNAQGDVFVDGEPYWDCPPYDLFGGPSDPPGGWSSETPAGAGYDDANLGVLALLSNDSLGVSLPPAAPDVSPAMTGAVCSFLRDPATGTTELRGTTVAPGADSSSVRCHVEDAATGTVLYDATSNAAGSVASLDALAASDAAYLTVCAEGTGTWGTRVVSTGYHCRLGGR